MARTRNSGNGRLEEALAALVQSQAALTQNQATLMQNQATLVQNQASFVGQMRETDRKMAEMERINLERFGRIESLLIEHNRILAEHSRLLEALPNTIREKIGFKAPERPGT